MRWPAGSGVEEATIRPQSGRAHEVPGDAADLSIRRAFLPLERKVSSNILETEADASAYVPEKSHFPRKVNGRAIFGEIATL
jgi:hypothetical protein